MHTAFIILVVVGFLFHFLAAVPAPAPLAVWPKPAAWLCWFIASLIWAVGTGLH